ncbi:sulfotransferase family protein [Acuticoccus yangtzensis]|uniref:sulfotransferase family protein n=1 Tax=Acuticoccus yangtzensis TaxID=1443441 RepID=UPI0009498A77|nr:sulfotransferase [Acuticoccus yangtzensis]
MSTLFAPAARESVAHGRGAEQARFAGVAGAVPIRVDRPVFVAGYVRSGTTLLRRMLNAHSNLFVPPESDMFGRIWPQLPPTVSDPAAVDAVIDSLPDYYGRLFDLAALKALVRARVPFRRPDFFGLVHACAVDAQGKAGARWGHKKPQEWPLVPMWLHAFPKGQVVHILRNPHDVIASVGYWNERGTGLHSVRTSPQMSAWHWRKSFRTVNAAGAEAGPSRYYLLRYVDLVADAPGELSALCAFLGLDESEVDAMVNWHTKDVRDEVRDTGAHMEKTFKPISADSIGRAKSELDPGLLADIDYICAREMDALGYAPAAPARVSASRALYLDAFCSAMEAAYSGRRTLKDIRARLSAH